MKTVSGLKWYVGHTLPSLFLLFIAWFCALSTYSHAADAVKTERYTLAMSKDDSLCKHMLKLFNQDLKKYGWKGDEHQEEHEEFKRVPWQPARFSAVIDGRVEYTDVESAQFDFNNDGVQDFVVRWKSLLFNARADLLFIFDSEAAKRVNELTSGELRDSKDNIYLGGRSYFLSFLSDVMVDPRVLEPFIYRQTSYVVMRPLFEADRTRAGYTVIAKYGEGQIVDRNSSGKMVDVCYFNRIGAKRVMH